jgi:hypothetical protein
MKNKLFGGISWVFFALVCLAYSSCEKKVELPKYTYSLSLALKPQQNAPALQSFVHGVDGDNWLLFAGRTNQDLDDGGLHDLNGNYTSTSFVPWSFNENILVYNVATDELQGMSFDDMVAKIQGYKAKTGLLAALKANETIFRNSNPLVTQQGEYVYVLGGYGTPINDTQSSGAYETFNQLARVHVPSLINLITTDSQEGIDWKNIFAFGVPDTLRSTGGEMLMIGDSLYVAGGHNFGNKASNFQKYLDGVFPMKITKTDSFSLKAALGAPISDLPAASISKSFADNKSTFRRRDGPIVPALFKNGNELNAGLTFYGGVFKPDSVVIKDKDTTSYLLAWNDAIYVHPGIKANNADTSSAYYTVDSKYYQANLNVYSCVDIELYDPNTNTVITFLVGGIGNGSYQGPETLSEFTNSLLSISYDVNGNSSTKTQLSTNIFGTTNFYGAESAFFFKNGINIPTVEALQGETEVINAGALEFSNNEIELGYLFGGIEAFEGGPGTYGPGKSSASNKIWKVTLSRSNN